MADACVRGAMRELGVARALSRPSSQLDARALKHYELGRCFETLAGCHVAQAWAKWCMFAKIAEASRSLQEEIFVTQREMRRTHALIVAVSAQAGHDQYDYPAKSTRVNRD